jgi:dTDP-4-amino-4,6-dideoxygalactose transaminase
LQITLGSWTGGADNSWCFSANNWWLLLVLAYSYTTSSLFAAYPTLQMQQMQNMQHWVQNSADTVKELLRGFASFFQPTRSGSTDAQHSSTMVQRAVQDTPEVAAEVAGAWVGPQQG